MSPWNEETPGLGRQAPRASTQPAGVIVFNVDPRNVYALMGMWLRMG